MKKILTTLLIIAVCISFSVTLATAAAAKVSVSFDGIENIMVQSSTSLQKIKADLDKATGDYSDLQHNVDSLKALNAVKPDSDLTAQYNTMKTNRDTAEIYYLTLKAQYDKNVMLQVLKTQQMYLTYDMDLRQETVKSMQLENKKQEIAGFAARLKAGFITQNKYDAADLDLQSLNDSVNSQQQKTASDLQSLRTALGVSDTSELTVLPVSYDEAVFAEVPAINFDADSANMLLNNVDVKAKEIAFEIKRGATVMVARNTAIAEVELAQAKESATLSFRQQYDSLMDAYRSYETVSSALKVKETAAANARLKYQYGYISKLQLNDLELAFQTAQLSETAQKNTLYCTYLRYVQMKNGD